jgi:hypothetical protein
MVILLDNDADLASKLAEEGLTRSRSPSPVPPPAYAPRSAEAAPLLGYRPPKDDYGRAAAKRLLRAYAWAFLLLALCSLFVFYRGLPATYPPEQVSASNSTQDISANSIDLISERRGPWAPDSRRWRGASLRSGRRLLLGRTVLLRSVSCSVSADLIHGPSLRAVQLTANLLARSIRPRLH